MVPGVSTPLPEMPEGETPSQADGDLRDESRGTESENREPRIPGGNETMKNRERRHCNSAMSRSKKKAVEQIVEVKEKKNREE